MKKARREFLKAGASLAAVQYLAGCSTIDDWVLKENKNDANTVLIIGAGLAGLAAAYTLKKNQIPYKVLEASNRHSGRVWTLRDLNVSSQYVDLGGERIEDNHAAIRNLARELKVEVREITPDEAWASYQNGSFVNPKDWRQDVQALSRIFQNVSIEVYGPTVQILNLQNAEQFPRAVLLDQMSAAELLTRLNKDFKPWMKPFLERLIRLQWGVEPTQISSLHLVHYMRDNFRKNQKQYKISGGSSSLTRALFERVSSVLPDKFVRFGYKLKSVRPFGADEVWENPGWTLNFQTAKGEVSIKASRVICTLPPPLLRDVDGWQLGFGEGQDKTLMEKQDLGNHSKVALSFKDRFWRESKILSGGGIWLTDLDSQAISIAGEPVSEGLATVHGILQAEIGGPASIQVGPHTAVQMMKDLQKLENKATSPEGSESIQNWKMSSFAGGSRSFLKPGQFQVYDTRVQASTTSWLFAGDSRSLPSLGSMNAAVQSAVDAANAYSAFAKKG